MPYFQQVFHIVFWPFEVWLMLVYLYPEMGQTLNIHITLVDGNAHSLQFSFCQCSGNSVKTCTKFWWKLDLWQQVFRPAFKCVHLDPVQTLSHDMSYELVCSKLTLVFWHIWASIGPTYLRFCPSFPLSCPPGLDTPPLRFPEGWALGFLSTVL